MFPAAHANGSQPNQPAAPQLAARVPAQALADIVREETQDGRLIVRFLVSTMQGNLEGAKPSHRLGAARQLISLGFDAAQSFVDSSTRPSGPRSGLSVSTPASSRPESLRHAQQLADLIRQETDNGRDAVRFLVDVMQGSLTDFKPHHRLAAARELLRRGFDPAPTEPQPASRHEPTGSAGVSPASLQPAPDADPAPSASRTPSIEYYYGSPEDYPFSFDTYGEREYQRDCYGSKALRHILGEEEAVRSATRAACEYREAVREAKKAAVNSGDDGAEFSIDFSDDSFGEDTYGYKALVYIYGSKEEAGAAYKGAADYHKSSGLLDDEDVFDTDDDLPDDPLDLPEPPELPPPRPMEPSRWELKAMARGHLTFDSLSWPVLDSATPLR